MLALHLYIARLRIIVYFILDKLDVVALRHVCRPQRRRRRRRRTVESVSRNPRTVVQSGDGFDSSSILAVAKHVSCFRATLQLGSERGNFCFGNPRSA